MFDFEAFEQGAGHDLTRVEGPLAGVSTYCCENCGALVQIGGPDSTLVLFHVPRGSVSTEGRCPPGGGPARPTLKDKLQALHEQSMDRLRRATEED